MILVTGANGIVGSNLLYLLIKQGKPVIAVKRKSSNLSGVKRLFFWYEKNTELYERIKWIELDLLDYPAIENALNNVSAVYHCAGMVSFDDKHYKQLKQHNEIATANLVNACLFKQVNTFCYVSSLAAINNSDFAGALHEGVFWKTSGKESAYAISKYNAEREVWRGMEEGLNAVIVNPGVVLSPCFENQSSGRLIAHCKKGGLFYPPGKTAYVWASDLAEIMIKLTEKKKFGERYLVFENMYSFEEILTELQLTFGNKKPRFRAGKWLLEMARLADALWSLLSGKQRKITKASLRSALSDKNYSNKKIINELHYPFTPVLSKFKDIQEELLLKC